MAARSMISEPPLLAGEWPLYLGDLNQSKAAAQVINC